MRAVRIDNALPKPLGAPEDWDRDANGHCSGLFIRPEIMDGVQFMRSAWEAAPEEAGLLLAGGKLILGISGTQHPVVNMGVAQLPDDFEPVVTARKIVTLGGTVGVRVDMLFSTPTEPKRGFVEVALESRSYASAVAEGIELVEELAKGEGWVL